MKIAILCHDLAAGGMTRAYWIAQLALALGHEVEIAGPLSRERSAYPEPPEEFRVTPVTDGSVAELARRLAASLETDLIYAIKPMRGSFGVALYTQRARRRPLVLDIDDWEYGLLDGVRSAPRQTIRRTLRDPARAVRGAVWHLRRMFASERRLSGRRLLGLRGEADVLTVNTRALAGLYGGTLLRSGKDTRSFDPRRFDAEAARASLGLSAYRVLLFPGTVQPHKGLEDVLDAMDRLAWPDLRLVIAGGRSTTYLEPLLRRGGTKILRLAQRPWKDMAEVVAAAHVVVVPQRDGPISQAQFPMKLADAMALGKPILCTAVGDVPEIVGDTAYLVEPGRADQIAGAIDRIFAEPEAAADRGQRARERCIERWSVDAIKVVLAEVLDRALAVRARRSASGTRARARMAGQPRG
jgi:glycosyltransferase involved in cell wall biosynthesis